MRKQKILVIVGPTAVGKTTTGIRLAKRFNGEVISGDSMQIYRELNIGTAKVMPNEMEGIPHHLLNERSIHETYTVADFKAKSEQVIQSLAIRGKLPIVVGGTGLYIQALLEDFQLGGTSETAKSTAKRLELENYLAQNGGQALWERLARQDKESAKAIHPNNQKRVVRALTIIETTGQPMTANRQQMSQSSGRYDVCLLGLTTERTRLYQRINQRVDRMLANGLLTEVELLAQERTCQAAQGIGYKEFFPYLDGERSLFEATELVKRNSRRYAKRQLTWFRNRMEVSWWDLLQDATNYQLLEKHVATWLEE